MDALTNVVAVLILVLVLVQADVTQKVVKFLEDLQPATPEEVKASKDLLEEIEKKKESVVEKLKEDAPTLAEIEEEKRRIALLEKSIVESDELLADVKELKELEEKIRKERDAENEQTVSIQEEIAKLEAQLDQTPVIQAPPPAEVTIPNSRPIPPKAVVYHALAIKDRVHIIDPNGLLEVFEEEFKKHKRDWLIERIKQQGFDRYIYDQEKITAHFKNFDFRNTQGQKVEIIAYPAGSRLHIEVSPDLEKGGTPMEELEKPGSAYSKAALKMKSDSRSVVLFHVNPDSFNTYLKGRGLLDRANIPAGWEVSGAKSWRFPIPDIEVNRLEDPPPAPDKPKPPGPPVIGPKLD
jgi:hypothetical protein